MDGDSTTSLGYLVCEEILPNIQSKPSLAQLEAVFYVLSFTTWEETDPHIATISFGVVVESNKFSPQHPFLQTKQPHLSQILLIHLVFWPFHQLCRSFLVTFQQLSIFLAVKSPKLNTCYPSCRRTSAENRETIIHGMLGILAVCTRWIERQTSI